MSDPQQLHLSTSRALNAIAGAAERSYLRPATDSATLQLVDRLLTGAGYPALPDDYAHLLSRACGIQGPYFTLLAPGALTTADVGVTPGIRQASDTLRAATDAAERLLVLGRASGNVLLVFGFGQYRLLDVQTGEVLRTYDGVADFIVDMIVLKDGDKSSG